MRAFRQALRAWMAERNLDACALEDALGYHSGGYLVRMYLGELETDRAPSRAFLERLGAAGFSGNGRDGDPFPIDLHPVVSGVVAVADLPAGTLILGQPRQCPECAAEATEGRRHPARTWYVFPHPRQKYCGPDHRRAWQRRRGRPAGSPHAEEKQSAGYPERTCVHCGTPFPVYDLRQRYCSARCRSAAQSRRRRLRQAGAGGSQ